MAPTPEESTPIVESSSADMTLKFKEIIKSNGITDPVSEVILSDSGLKGENFASQVQLVTIKFENPKLKPLNLFMKRQTENPSHTAMVEDSRLFEKEAVFFMNYLPQAQEFCKRKGKEDLMNIYPRCYHGDKKIMVFENLVKDKGYMLLDKEELQDFEAARIALTALAKHHGISYAFIKENGGPQKFFQKFEGLDFESFTTETVKDILEPTLENGLTININLIQQSKGVEGKEKQEAISLLKSCQGKIWGIMNETSEINDSEEEEDIRVLNHGDYWNNNMMFLMDKQTSKLVDHKAVDFQATKYGSPSLDLSYYLYSSVKPELRQSRLQELLQIYLETLQNTTKDLGHPIPLTFERLFTDFRKKLRFGFWFGTLFFSSATLAVMKSIDPSKVEMSEWAAVINQLIEKWMEDNPEKSEENAKHILRLMTEYAQLTL